jgi:LAO/AO transport system kinase
LTRSKIIPKKQPTVNELIEGILAGNQTLLARAITIIESTNKENRKKATEIVNACFDRPSQGIRIGITGVPGVGKSTFIEAFGKMMTKAGKKVAVLAVDPSSTLSKGSILGDKTRMTELVKDAKAFIRPSPSAESLGGVTRKTREAILLCEAAGYEIVLIETVGVGQSEIAVHGMVDFFLLLKLPGAGDELQGIKRGIVEMADAIVINKADGDNEKAARIAQMDFNKALHLYPPKENGWVPKVLSCSALHNKGLEAVWHLVEDYLQQGKSSGSFDSKRKQQRENWLFETLEDHLKRDFFQNKVVKKELKKLIPRVRENEIPAFSAAEQLLQLHQQESS